MSARKVILVLNVGSSSVKFAAFDAADLDELAYGAIEGLGTHPHVKARGDAIAAVDLDLPDAHVDQAAAVGLILDLLTSRLPDVAVVAVAHRIVHGGTDYAAPVILDAAVVARLERLVPLAPLHQPHNLAGVAAAERAFPKAAQIACFDTAFHRSHPWVADTYALPARFYDEGVRRYGFHGLSYEAILRILGKREPALARRRLVVAHLGSGASMCAVRDGKSQGSSMGFSALDGLPMGTRCGQLDPGVLLWMMSEKGMDAAALTALLYKESGLKGLSGVGADVRALSASDRPEAAAALDYFVHRVRREIGAMAAILGGVDAVVLTGGIGENAAALRGRILAGFDWLGLAFDAAANAVGATRISAPGSAVTALVVATDEEGTIARHAKALLDAAAIVG